MMDGSVTVALVNPPAVATKERWDRPDFPCIGLAYVGGYLERTTGVVPVIVDGKLARLSPAEVIDAVVALKPRIVGLTAMTHMVVGAAHIAAEVKRRLPGVVTVCGGIHAGFLPERTVKEFPSFDYVVAGEGEIAFCDLVQAILGNGPVDGIPGVFFRKDGVVAGSGRGVAVSPLDEVGAPAWHLYPPEILSRHLGMLPVMSQRGCPFACNFCSRPYGQKARRRSPNQVVDEIELGYRTYGVSRFSFYDETFTLNKPHTEEICREIIRRNLHHSVEWEATMHANTADLEMIRLIRQANCQRLWFGVESGNDAVMARMNKGVTKDKILNAVRICREVGLPFCPQFIIGHPNETLRTALDTIRFAIKLNGQQTPIGVMTPYPGTEIWEMAIRGEGGYRRLSHNWDDFAKQGGKAVELENLPRWQMQGLQILGQVAIHVFNLRFAELFALVWNERRLALAIVRQILAGAFSRRSETGN